MFLLSLLDALEDSSHIKLHTADEGDFKDKCTHKAVEDFAALLFQVDCFIVLEITEYLVVSHGQFHHSIDFSL
jgi:hypothetical protein